MLDFLTKLEEKHAFKKAVKEMKQRGFIFDNTITRVYHNNISSNKDKDVKLNTSDTVDTAYFKDWRGDNKLAEVVENIAPETILQMGEALPDTTKPVASFKTVGNKFFITDDEEDEISDIKPKQTVIDLLDKKNSLKPNYAEMESFKSFLDDELNQKLAAQQDEDFVEPVKSEPTEEIEAKQTKIDDYALKRSEMNKKIQDFLSKVDQNNKTTTINIVAKQKPQTIKKKTVAAQTATKKRTRGKAKRKFDADVITSVDWRD